MGEINQILRLSLFIFLIPLISINLCLFISVNYSLFDGTIFAVDFIGRSNFTIPYLDGSLSISRASRTYPQYLIFKPAMVITSLMLIFYWSKTNSFLKTVLSKEKNFYFKFFGILSAIFLLIHSILLGVNFEISFLKLLKRVFLLCFILFEIAAQGTLIFIIFKNKMILKNLYSEKILKLKLFLVSILVLVALVSLPILNSENYTHFKHGLEWNYFIGVIGFYLLTRLFWKRTT